MRVPRFFPAIQERDTGEGDTRCRPGHLLQGDEPRTEEAWTIRPGKRQHRAKRRNVRPLQEGRCSVLRAATCRRESPGGSFMTLPEQGRLLPVPCLSLHGRDTGAGSSGAAESGRPAVGGRRLPSGCFMKSVWVRAFCRSSVGYERRRAVHLRPGRRKRQGRILPPSGKGRTARYFFLHRSRHIICVMVPMGQKAHHVRGLYRAIIRRPRRNDVSMML